MPAMTLKASIGMDKHLRIPVNPLVEFLIRHLCILDRNLMANHKARLCLPRNDQIPQVPVIRLDIALSRRQTQTLFDVRQSA
jgi:hypothetical protein